MIINKYIFILFLLIAGNNSIFSQEKSPYSAFRLEKCVVTYFDIDSLPYEIEWLTNKKLDSVKYVDLNGKEYDYFWTPGDSSIFDGGLGALKSFFNKELSIPSSIETNGAVSVVFFLKQSAMEVRIIKRIGYDCRYYDYDKEVRRVLLMTKDKWRTQHINTKYPILLTFLFEIP